MHKQNKTKFLSARLTPETHRAALRVAAFTNRTLGGLVEYTLRHYINAHYPDAYGTKPMADNSTRRRAANGE